MDALLAIVLWNAVPALIMFVVAWRWLIVPYGGDTPQPVPVTILAVGAGLIWPLIVVLRGLYLLNKHWGRWLQRYG